MRPVRTTLVAVAVSATAVVGWAEISGGGISAIESHLSLRSVAYVSVFDGNHLTAVASDGESGITITDLAARVGERPQVAAAEASFLVRQGDATMTGSVVTLTRRGRKLAEAPGRDCTPLSRESDLPGAPVDAQSRILLQTAADLAAAGTPVSSQTLARALGTTPATVDLALVSLVQFGQLTSSETASPTVQIDHGPGIPPPQVPANYVLTPKGTASLAVTVDCSPANLNL